MMCHINTVTEKLAYDGSNHAHSTAPFNSTRTKNKTKQGHHFHVTHSSLPG